MMVWVRDLIRKTVGLDGPTERIHREELKLKQESLNMERDERVAKFKAATKEIQRALRSMEHKEV